MKKIDYKNIYAIMVIVILLIASDTIYVHVYPQADNILKIISLLFSIIPAIIARIIRKKEIVISFLFLFPLIIISLINGMPIGSTIGIYSRFWGILCFCAWCKYKEIDYLYYLYKILFCTTIVCLIFYVLFDVGIARVPYKVVFSKESRTPYFSYLGIYYHWGMQFVRKVFGLSIRTSNGFWSEPGAYQIFTNFALFYALFIKQNTRKIELFILSVAVITSGSAMGAIILVMLWAVWIIYINKFRIMLLPLSLYAAYMGVSYLLIEKSKTTNWTSRMNNQTEMFSKFIASPIVGSGMNKEIWSGLYNYLINYGILGIAPFLCIIFGLNHYFLGKKSMYVYIAFVIWWFLSLLNEAYGYNNLIFVVYAACILGKKNGKKNCSC